jgi:GTPase SAR1 family protein
MKIAVIHLSDLHIQTPKDPILLRSKNIATAVRGLAPDADAYLMAVTGDVAFSGETSQYKWASEFFKTIKEEFQESGTPFFQVFVPGNHDLNLKTEPDTRPLLLKALPDTIDKLALGGATARQMVRVQNEFFKFESGFTGSKPRSTEKKLADVISLSVGNLKLKVKTFNTAWVSTNPENQGQLLYPIRSVAAEEMTSDLVLCLFHHPYNWLECENARLFRHHVETTSDVVFTGHEHESCFYARQQSDMVTTQYVEGAVLQESGTNRSTFNVVQIDTSENTYEAFLAQWNGELYKGESTGVHSFIRNKLLCKSVFTNNNDFQRFLNEPGLPLSHPRKRDLRLDDLYVYPSLAVRELDKASPTIRLVESHEVLQHVRSIHYLLIAGEDTIGKTSFAKRLYRDLQSEGDTVPIYVSGQDFRGHKEADIRRIITKALTDQYDQQSVDRFFFSLEREQRVLIVDDWHLIKYLAKGRSSIIEHLKSLFGKVICFSNRLHVFDELTQPGSARTIFADFEFYEIKEFGKRLTGKLIEKWHALGRDYSDDLPDYYRAVASSEHKISAIIGKGVLPTYPVFLIGLLQADSSPSSSSQSAGSYGHVLEAVITARLAEVSKKSTDVGLMYTYLSRIAYSLFKKDRAFISANELSDIHDEYCEKYQIKLSDSKIVDDLLKARMLLREGDSYRFRYKGLFCYFVAFFFSENLSGDAGELRIELNQITDRLAWEDYTNILMLFLYRTRDPQIIERLLHNAAQVYAEYEPADLDNDVAFVNKLLKEKPNRLLLPSTDLQANRDNFREQQDTLQQGEFEEESEISNQKVPYNPGLDEMLKLCIALQTLRVMGQVLRNFPGVLTAEPKYRLAEAAYLLGLRALKRLLYLGETQLEELRTLFAQMFKDRHPLATVQETERNADQALIWLTGGASYGMVKRICSSVGLQDLELTFQAVRKQYGDMTSIKLVDLSIKLEYFRETPEAEIFDLEKDLQRNIFSYKILRDLVAEHLYLHNTDTRVLQRLGNLFEIRTSDPSFLLNKAVGTNEAASQKISGKAGALMGEPP